MAEQDYFDELEHPGDPDVAAEPEWADYVRARKEALETLRGIDALPPRPQAHAENKRLWDRTIEIMAAVRSLAQALEGKGYSLRVDGTRIRVKGKLPAEVVQGPSSDLPAGWRHVYCPHCGAASPRPPAAEVWDLEDDVEVCCTRCGRPFLYGELLDAPPEDV